MRLFTLGDDILFFMQKIDSDWDVICGTKRKYFKSGLDKSLMLALYYAI